MSRTVRKQLFSIVELLEKANRVLEKSLVKSKVNEEEMIGLLTDSQDAAVSIGNMIEALYGEGTDTVKELESYCEALYQTALAIKNLPARTGLVKQMKKQLGRIRRQLGVDVPDKLEVVFLPYKAAMWDSLESVWQAAKEDEEADTYVIPIPYYDKNPDGSFKQEYYEAEEFPNYVDITDYNDYNFELRQPDIVFIHNPYDDANYVTSVHPFFYSSNLKKFTNKLVYIPYFILNGEVMPEHHVLCPGVLHADYIIALSEREKEDYVRHMKAHYPQIDLTDKVLALGSPKLDKVRSLNKESMAIPEEWKQRAKGKKVILYNTSINGLLHNDEAYLEKMERVFALFEKREDAVLLWRPHPLLESTLLSMRAGLYEKYIELKERFIADSNGIYDDKPDMYPAIGLSDAYYGDWSSLVWLYRETGKPVMIQDVEVE